MKSLALLAIVLSVLGNAAYAEGTANSVSDLALAFNGNFALTHVKTDKLVNKVDADVVSSAMAQVSSQLDKQLEDKIARELDYAMH